MPLGWTNGVRTASAARGVDIAWFLDLACLDIDTGDPAPLRCWSLGFNTMFDGEAYEGLGRRLTPPDDIVSQLGTAAEPVSFVFDASAILVSTDFVARLFARDWHQRPIRARVALFDPDSNFTQPIGTEYDWAGIMDRAPFTHGDGARSQVELSCETGSIRLRSASPRWRTAQDHRRIAPTDTFYDRMPVALTEELPFNAERTTPPGAAVGGGGAGSGGAGRTQINIRNWV